MKLLKKHATIGFYCLAGMVFAQVAYAATVSAHKQADFLRLNLAGADAKGMKLEANGKTLVLDFPNEPKLTAAQLQQRLGSYASHVETIKGGKGFKIDLDKPYRVRQFVSSNGVGFDVMDSVAPSALPKANPKELAKTEEQKPVAKPEPKKSVTPEKPKAKAPLPKLIKPRQEEKPATEQMTPEEAIAKAIEPESKPAPKAEPQKKSAPEAKVIKIKEPVKPEPEPASTPKAPQEEMPPASLDEPVASPAITTLPVPASQTPPPPSKEAPKQPATEAKHEAKQETPPPATAATPTKSDSMLVGVINNDRGKQIVFPWKKRIAASVFQRDTDWWVVFSEPVDVDTTQLKAILPQGITDVAQFSAPKNTVLRFRTNGSVIPSVSQKDGSYDWFVNVSNTSQPLVGSYDVRSVLDAPLPYLQISAYDITPPLTFVDPERGDQLMVIPTYEAGKAIAKPYSNPQVTFLPSVQGIAMQLATGDITATSGRDGVRIMSAGGLSLSSQLPTPKKEVQQPTAASVMFPYEKWRVAAENFADTRIARTKVLADAPDEGKPEAMYDLVTMYLGQGMSEEALSLLTRMQMRYPDYYRDHQLALLRAAANFMIFRMGEAAGDVTSEDIADNPETKLWKEAIGIFVPQILAPPAPPKDPSAPATDIPEVAMPTAANIINPQFDYIGYNNNYIRFYPPAMRQKLAIIAADNFVANKDYSKAARTLDLLNKDGILQDIQLYAEYLLGKIAAETGKTDQAIDLWTPLAKQEKNLFIHARASFSLATLQYNNGKANLEDTIKKLDRLRIVWRGDTLEQNLLSYLGQLYYDNKDYANALRTWKDYTTNFAGTFESVNLSKHMSELFQQLFGDGLADDMPPLKSLALFYEFRDLTPIGDKGDMMIQKLADRLAKLDLLDRAAALLEHQVKFRLQGEERSRVGAQLALLQLLNKEPQKALDALEISGYGGASPALATERNRLTAMALARVGKPAVGLEMLAADRTPQGQALRMEILWDMKDWPNVINVAEDMLGNRTKIAAPLTNKETETLLKLALAYSFESDMTQLKYLRDYYTPLLVDSPYKDIFAFITNDTAPVDTEDFEMVAKQIADTESFLKSFREKIAAGRLSAIGNENPADEDKTQEPGPSISDQNKPLVPESATPAQALPAEPIEKSSEESGPQKAPVEVAPDQKLETPEDAAKKEAAPFMETPEAEKAVEDKNAKPAETPPEENPAATPTPEAIPAADAPVETPALPPAPPLPGNPQQPAATPTPAAPAADNKPLDTGKIPEPTAPATPSVPAPAKPTPSQASPQPSQTAPQ